MKRSINLITILSFINIIYAKGICYCCCGDEPVVKAINHQEVQQEPQVQVLPQVTLAPDPVPPVPATPVLITSPTLTTPLTPTVPSPAPTPAPSPDPNPPVSPRVFEVEGMRPDGNDDFYCYNTESGSPLEIIFSNESSKIKFREFGATHEHRSGLLFRNGECYFIKKGANDALIGEKLPTLRSYSDCEDVSSPNNLRYGDHEIFIVLPSNAELELRSDAAECYAEIKQLTLERIPGYWQETGFGWIYDFSLATLNYKNKKAITINKDLQMKLCVWDQAIRKIFAIPVKHQLTPQDIFTGLIANPTGNPAEGELEGKKVKTVTLGGVRYAINKINRSGLLLAETASDTVEAFDLETSKQYFKEKYEVDQGILGSLKYDRLGHIGHTIKSYIESFNAHKNSIQDESSYNAACSAISSSLSEAVCPLWNSIPYNEYKNGIDVSLQTRYINSYLGTAQEKFSAIIEIDNAIGDLEAQDRKEKEQIEKEASLSREKSDFLGKYGVILSDLSVNSLYGIISNELFATINRYNEELYRRTSAGNFTDSLDNEGLQQLGKELYDLIYSMRDGLLSKYFLYYLKQVFSDAETRSSVYSVFELILELIRLSVLKYVENLSSNLYRLYGQFNCRLTEAEVSNKIEQLKKLAEENDRQLDMALERNGLERKQGQEYLAMLFCRTIDPLSGRCFTAKRLLEPTMHLYDEAVAIESYQKKEVNELLQKLIDYGNGMSLQGDDSSKTKMQGFQERFDSSVSLDQSVELLLDIAKYLTIPVQN